MLRRLLQSEYLILALSLAYFAALAPVVEGFASSENLANMLAAMAPLLIVAVGQTLVLVSGGIDLSMTSVIALASVTGSMLITRDGGWLGDTVLAVPAGIVVMLAVGFAVGSINGSLVAWARMPPFIVTLTTMMFFSGLAVWLTQSKSIYDLPPGLLLIGKRLWIAASLAVLVAAAAHVALSRTLYGRRLYAVGQSARTAEASGVPVARTTLRTYILCGLCAGAAAVLITGRLETGSPVHWRNNLLDIIGATVIGGTSLFGGKGKVAWTASGVLFLTLLDNSLNLLNFSHFAVMMVKGAVILLAASLDAVRNRLLATR
jgi:ribose/xylose/arabinose/galactoside ABC-type transport system permease subunit